MKTLDEVIKAFSEVNKEVGCGDCQFNDADSDDIPCEMTDCFFNDALHYLREYQRDKQIFSYDVAKRNLELSERNEPLTWDELKLMEGKPVWIEEIGQKYSSPHWVIHYGIEDAYDGDEILYLQPFFETETKNSLGMTWQAYRKERK